MTLWFGFVLAPVVAGLLASVLCCLSILRDQKPPWSHAILSAPLGIFCSLWFLFGGDVLRPSHWPGRIPEQWDSFAIALVPSFSLTTVVVLIAVALSRERLKKHLSREQRRSLSRQRHQRAWQRARWFHLFASGSLMVGLTSALVWSHSARAHLEDTEVVSDYQAAQHWDPHSPPKPERQVGAGRKTPAFNLAPVTAALWPVCILGLVASGGWFAYTVAYWRGYMKVRPRHRRDLLAWHHPPAAGP
jgi:hypothetical protein